MILIACIGILLLYVPNFGVVIVGLVVFTFNFFVVHVLCDHIVSEFDVAKRSVTISLHLLAYYLGSSILGSATGLLLDSCG